MIYALEIILMCNVKSLNMLAREMKTDVCPMINVPVLHIVALFVFVCTSLSPSYLAAADEVESAYLRDFDGFLDPSDDDKVAHYINEFIKYAQTTEELLARGIVYFPMIENELSQRGLPEELKVLPLVESRFNPMAISHVGAAGLWQLMIPTAREFGLRINKYLDERRDPVKATKAAIEYLEYLHGKYDDWSLAFAAYNAGPGRVNRAIRMAGGIRDFDAIKQFLPRQTREYIPKYQAAQYILEHHKEHGISPNAPELDIQWTESVHVNEYMSLDEIASVVDVSEDVLKMLNPSLKRDFVPNISDGYDLVLPKRVAASFLHYLETDESGSLLMHYETELHILEQPLSIFEVADVLDTNPYLIKIWNSIRGEEIKAGAEIVIYRLIDPNAEEPIIPNEIIPAVPIISSRIDIHHEISEVIKIQVRKTEEALSWSLHQM